MVVVQNNHPKLDQFSKPMILMVPSYVCWLRKPRLNRRIICVS